MPILALLPTSFNYEKTRKMCSRRHFRDKDRASPDFFVHSVCVTFQFIRGTESQLIHALERRLVYD